MGRAGVPVSCKPCNCSKRFSGKAAKKRGFARLLELTTCLMGKAVANFLGGKPNVPKLLGVNAKCGEQPLGPHLLPSSPCEKQFKIDVSATPSEERCERTASQ